LKMNIRQTSIFTTESVNQECCYCKNKATHVLVASGYFSGIRIRMVCEEHKKEWLNGTLNI